IARGNHHEGGTNHHRREQIKKPRRDIHRLTPFAPFPGDRNENCRSLQPRANGYRYGASSARLRAISRSHRSPFAKSRSLSKKSSSRVSTANSEFGPSTMASTGQAS